MKFANKLALATDVKLKEIFHKDKSPAKNIPAKNIVIRSFLLVLSKSFQTNGNNIGIEKRTLYNPVLTGGRWLNFTNIPPVAKKQIDKIINKIYLVSLL